MTQTFRRGLIEGTPIVVAYLALGAAFGILAAKAGVPVWAAVGMSLLGYAGSAQFVVVSLIAEGASLPIMLGSTLLLNLRHLLLSSSLTTKLPALRRRQLGYFAHSITDESYGVNMMRAKRHGQITYESALGTNIIAHFSWVMSTWLGSAFAHWITWDLSLFNGAIPVMFASLLAFQVSERRDWFWVCVSVLLTLPLLHFLPGQGAFLITVLAVPTFAVFVESRQRRRHGH